MASGLSRHVFTFELELFFGVERRGVDSFKKSLSPVSNVLVFSLDDSHPDGRTGLTQCGAQRDMHALIEVLFGLVKLGFLVVGQDVQKRSSVWKRQCLVGDLGEHVVSAS